MSTSNDGPGWGVVLILFAGLSLRACSLDAKVTHLETRLDGLEHVEGTSTPPVTFQP